jgi:hypothetical protein
MGTREYECTPWGNPTYTIFGWQKPCYLLQDGYTQTFGELMETTNWGTYGTGRDERCADCMVHCGYEPTAVDDSFSSVKGFLATVRAALFGYRSVLKRPREAQVPARGRPVGVASPGLSSSAPGADFVELSVLHGSGRETLRSAHD